MSDMTATTRRIIAIEAHRRRTGHCPTLIHALGTGETFEVEPFADGFLDRGSGQRVEATPDRRLLSAGRALAELRLTGDLGFEGFDVGASERFTGSAGGGASVTLHGADPKDYSQYAVVGFNGEYLTEPQIALVKAQ